MGHHKAASCSAIPSYNGYPTITVTDNRYHKEDIQQTTRMIDNTDDISIALPSICLYSSAAFKNEYATSSDIIQFLSPTNKILEERLPEIAGVLHSLSTTIRDMSFGDEDDEDDDESTVAVSVDDLTEDIHSDDWSNHDDEDDEDEDDEDEDEDDYFTIIGLRSMKLIVCHNMQDFIMDTVDDLCIVIIISSGISDLIIKHNMNIIRQSLMHSLIKFTPNEIGAQLIPLIHCWFST